MNGILDTFNNSELEKDKYNDILAFYGKTSRGSKRLETCSPAQKALHTVNVYSSNNGVCMVQVFVDEKTNEIPAMIDLLNIIDTKGCILTWDALNTQKDTVAKVISKKSDYVGTLKVNQHNFYKDVKDYFEDDVLNELNQSNTNYIIQKENSHSSVITREYYLSTNIQWVFNKKDWKGLKSIGLEHKKIERNNGELIIERRYFISSLTDIKYFSKALKNHWGVENGLHWHLDFTFKDDQNTTTTKLGGG